MISVMLIKSLAETLLMDTTSQRDDLEKIDVVINENETPLKAAGGTF